MDNKIIRSEGEKRKFISVFLTLFITMSLTLLGIYGIGDYGVALFILIPFLIGACTTFFYGFKKQITFIQAYTLSFVALGVFTLSLLLFAIEGIICILMAAPFAVSFTFLGSFCCYYFLKKSHNNTPAAILILIISIPLTSFIEKDSKPTLVAVKTSICINASPEKVWENVIEFPQLDEPAEFIFKAGISYPINAKIDGKGVGAVRYCNFTTGSFIEPIVVWDEPKLLKFDVLEQPAPMKEISFWDIDAPHLHDFFVSKQGQFKLTALENGQTFLEGTTWYYHKIKPELYWQLWSDLIIHKIHNRVLYHIKANSEKGNR